MIDVFEVWFLHRLQVQSRAEDPIEIVDLVPKTDLANQGQRFGGRFWVLVDDHEEDSEEEPD